ncbi:MAG TPA: peptidase domain-containing ABC transporter [Candidatus Obscuribacterales bacterium]
MELSSSTKRNALAVLSHVVSELSPQGDIVTFHLGEVVYHEGAQLDSAYVLIEGKVRLYLSRGAGETTVGILEKNDWFGLETFCLQTPAFCSCRTSDDARILKISNDLLSQYTSAHPAVKEALSAAAQELVEQKARLESESDAPAATATRAGDGEREGMENPPLPSAEARSTASKISTPGARSSVEEESFAQSGVRSFVRKGLRLYPLAIQQTAMDCGVCCMFMIMQYYDRKVGLRKLRDLVGVTPQGTDLLSMAECAEKLGFTTRGIKASYEGLLRAKLPLICHWDSNHYVVLYEIDRDRALIADPADGLNDISRDDFVKHFSMYALELTPDKAPVQLGAGAPPVARFLTYLTPHKRTLVDIGAASLVVQLLTLCTPLFTQVVIDRVLVHHSLSMLNMILIGMLILILFQSFISAIRAYLVAFTAVKLDQSLFVQFFKHVLSLPFGFFEEHTTGDIISRLQENHKLQAFISGPAIASLTDLVTAFLCLLLVFFYNMTFGVLVIGYLIVFSLLFTGITPVLRSFMRRIFQKEVATNSYMIEAIRGIERIKSAAAENRARWAWEELFVDELNLRYKGTLVARFSQIGANLVELMGGIMFLWFGAHLVIAQSLSIGQLMALTLIVSRITAPVIYLVTIWGEIQDLGVALERLSDVLDQAPEEAQQDSKIVISLAGDVKFEGVTFKYPGNESVNAVQNLSFEVKAGQTVGIVGRSGCGKSTMLKLMQGLYLPTAGRILIDGHDIRHLSLREYRRQIGVVSQQDYIFRGTIRDTISYYNPQASFEEIFRASKLAGVHEFIDTLPKSYEYEIAEGGINLSGGQRQRLCIARAILNDPRLLLFDEATSFLDYDSEQAIQENLEKLRKGRTIFLVAHRLSTVKDADLILVVDRGEIIERGDHETLLERKGAYYHLWAQALS